MAMDSVRWILFLSYILTTLFACVTNAQQNFTAKYCNYAYTDIYTSDSAFKKNLDTLDSILETAEVSFRSFSIGQNPERVNVIALCRGDVAWDKCRSCLMDASTVLRGICLKEKQSIGWYDECMLRYSDRTIANAVQTLPNAYAFNPTLVSGATTAQFNQAVKTLLNNLLDEASRGSSVRKFATRSIRTGPSNTITLYGLAECTPDLNMQQCRKCLSGTADMLPKCCNGTIGGRVLYPSCNFRYEIGKFYDDV